MPNALVNEHKSGLSVSGRRSRKVAVRLDGGAEGQVTGFWWETARPLWGSEPARPAIDPLKMDSD